MTHIYWSIGDFMFLTPPRGFFGSCVLFFTFWGYIKIFGHYGVLEMYYKMFVPICFQDWSIFRLQINIFAELLSNLWFWPIHRAFLALGCYCSLFEAKYKNVDTMECLKCIIKCLYQFDFKFEQFLDFKLTLLNYWRFCDFHTPCNIF